MHAHKISVTVPASRRLEIELPSDLPEGEAEVIVLFPQRAAQGPVRPRPGSREAILAAEPVTEAWRTANPDKLLTADEIDAYLAEERASWGNEP